MKDLNFEKALADLEHTVEKLEKGGLSLNESLSLFEKGVKLARYLRDELDRAEKKIEILLKDEKGGVRREPFDLEEADSAGGEESGQEEEEEGRGTKKARSRGPKKESGGDDTLPF